VSARELPYPPLQLANRVGCLEGAAEPFDYYDELGLGGRSSIVDRLPRDWSFEGKRVLDFGCGAGRTLRHFVAETADAEFWGCDIDEASISWMSEYLCPPFHVFVNGPEPPLEQPDSSFDLIWGISVFTHLTDSWSRWLVELHRILKPDGLLYLTFMGSGMSELITGEPWREDGTGMNVTKCGQSWDLGGPMVMHSPWWIQEHWGRAFEILSLLPDGFVARDGPAEAQSSGQGSVLMRKRAQAVDPAALERVEPGDARETAALLHSIQQLQGECATLRGELVATAGIAAREVTAAKKDASAARDRSHHSAQRLLEVEEILAQARARIFDLENEIDARGETIDDMRSRLDRADRVLRSVKTSLSWRITAPLRALKQRG
jgi:SAM-dependent methyltransferase